MLLFDFYWNRSCRLANHAQREADCKNRSSVVRELFLGHPLNELLDVIDSPENILDACSPISSGH